MHDLKTMKLIGRVQDSLIYDELDYPELEELDGWDKCDTPVICIFDGQYDITDQGPATAWHHTWKILVIPVDNVTVWDVLKDKVAAGNKPEDNAGIGQKCYDLINHGTAFDLLKEEIAELDDEWFAFCDSCNDGSELKDDTPELDKYGRDTRPTGLCSTCSGDVACLGPHCPVTVENSNTVVFTETHNGNK